MNTRYAKVDRNGDIVYAPTALPVSGGARVGASAQEYAAAGWLPVNRDWAPAEEPPAGRRWARTGRWNAEGGEVRPAWEPAEIPPAPPRVFSKLRVVAALMGAGVWPQVKAWMEREGLYDLYLAANEFAEDNEWFVAGKAQLQSELGWTDARAEAVLAAGEV